VPPEARRASGVTVGTTFEPFEPGARVTPIAVAGAFCVPGLD